MRVNVTPVHNCKFVYCKIKCFLNIVANYTLQSKVNNIIMAAGSLAVKSDGPITKRLLVCIPELARWKNVVFCP